MGLVSRTFSSCKTGRLYPLSPPPPGPGPRQLLAALGTSCEGSHSIRPSSSGLASRFTRVAAGVRMSFLLKAESYHTALYLFSCKWSNTVYTFYEGSFHQIPPFARVLGTIYPEPVSLGLIPAPKA